MERQVIHDSIVVFLLLKAYYFCWVLVHWLLILVSDMLYNHLVLFYFCLLAALTGITNKGGWVRVYDHARNCPRPGSVLGTRPGCCTLMQKSELLWNFRDREMTCENFIDLYTADIVENIILINHKVLLLFDRRNLSKIFGNQYDFIVFIHR